MNNREPISPGGVASGITLLAGTDSDDARRRRLRRNRILATVLLAAMGAIFVATRMVPNPGFTTLLIQAGAEAGMIGGLADWFAVTALFRYPLGLPIPHTAIIPNNKDRIGRTLGRFVEQNFLTQDVLIAKLRQISVGQRIAAWLAAPATAPLVAGTITAALPYLMQSLRNRDLRDFVQRTMREQFVGTDFAPAMGQVIRLLTASGEADVLFERALEIGIQWIEQNRQRIDAVVSERSRWWIPKAIDRRIAAAIVSGVTETLDGLRKSDSEARAKFRAALNGLVNDLLNSPQQREQVNAAVRRVFESAKAQAWFRSIWGQLYTSALDDLAQPQSRVRQALEKPIAVVARGLANDLVMQRHIDEVVERLAVLLIERRGEIGSFITEVVRNWDARTLSDRLELVVGSDLQYIRMNGTIVGACAGCLIFLATQLL